MQQVQKVKKWKLWLVAAVALIVCIFLFLQKPLDRITTDAQDSFGKAILGRYKTAQAKYFDEHHAYANPEDSSGFYVPEKGASLYFKLADLPTEYQKLIPETAWPYLKPDSYQVLLAVPHIDNQELEFWSMSDVNPPRKIKVTQPAK